LDPNRLYRVDRYDVPSDVPGELSIEQQLEFCRNNVIRINDRNQTRPPIPQVDWSLKHWRVWPVTNATRRVVYSVIRGPNAVKYAAVTQLKAVQNRLFPDTLLPYFMFQIPVDLHTNACGDFTMLSSDRWAAVRAYPELEMYSMHIDSLLCYMAHHSGVREMVLPDPYRIYHIEHGIGSGFTPEGAQALYSRLDTAGVDRLEYEQILDWAIEMRRNGPILFNEENWGLADYDLPEMVVRRSVS
jgi:hypothetical protein